MDKKTENLLNEAVALFHAWRLPESYNLFRRFFDRIPFRPEKEHSIYMGMFCRVLKELGRTNELDFYLKQVERWHRFHPEPYLAHQIGIINIYKKNLPHEQTRKIFEDIVRDPNAKEIHFRAKLCLAAYYDRCDDETSLQLVVDSMREDPEELLMKAMLYTWRALVARNQGDYETAYIWMKKIFSFIKLEDNWYVYTCAKTNLAWIYIRDQRIEEAKHISKEVALLLSNKTCKDLADTLSRIQAEIFPNQGKSTVSFLEDESLLTCAEKRIRINTSNPSDRVLVLLAKEQYLEKERIVRDIYNRDYSKKDDRLIHSHIHSVRKRLKQIGLPGSTVQTEPAGYRLGLKVKFVQEEK